jgi:glutamine amidotransferase-like uncharacterized protein
MQILIYQDYIHNNAVLFKACRALKPTKWVDAADIVQSHVLDNPQQLLIIPGGASRFYAEKLDGAGNVAIKNFVAAGGTYVGICAGAYYAAKTIDWQPPIGKSIQCTHELGFFNGCATGPLAFEKLMPDRDHLPLGVISISGPLTNHTPHNVLYWAGPCFDSQVMAADNWQILANYAHGHAAIITKKIGLGRVILCSPHIEYGPQDFLNRAYAEFSDNDLWQIMHEHVDASLLTSLFTKYYD